MAQRIELPVRRFIERKLRENFPEFDFRRSTALNDAVANPISLLIQPFRNELDGIKVAQSLKNYNYLADEQVDDLLFNLLVFRKNGEKAFGTVRINFFALGDYSYDTLTFVTESGLRFFNSSPIAISASSLILNEDGTYYYDVPVESESTGSEYSIANNTIVSILESIPEIVSVTNPFAFTQGEGKETNFDLFKRAQDAVISRTLLNEYAIKTVLFNEFGFITDLSVVGAGNSAMLRDIINIDGRNIHTYGKVDVYINTNSVQEDDVDITYIPEDLTIDIVANTATETVFPETTDTSSSGNCRNLFFEDALYDYGSRSYYNNVLRIYQTKFNEDTYTDFIVKSQTLQGELVVVENKLAEGSKLIAYGNGYINIDGFISDLADQVSFKGSDGQGNSYSYVTINAPNFIFDRPVQNIVETLTGCSATADSCFVSYNDIVSPTISTYRKNQLVITKGDAVGAYDVFWEMDNSTELHAFGQTKQHELRTSIVISSTTSLNFTHLERCAQVNDYVVIIDKTGSNGAKFSTITSVDFASNSISFSAIAFGGGAEDYDIFIKDGIRGTLEDTDQCYIVDNSVFGTVTANFNTSGATSIVYGSGTTSMTYLRKTNIGLSKSTGDYVLINGGADHQVVSVPSVNEVILKGLITFSGNLNFYQGNNTPTASPVIIGSPFTLVASGIFDSDVNTVTLASATNSNFVHPNVAVNVSTTSLSPWYSLVNMTTLRTYTAPTGWGDMLTTYGINGLHFSNAVSGETISFSSGDMWAIIKSTHSTYTMGGSSWLDYFSWFDTPTLNDTSYGFIYPDTNPMMKLVIAGGPNSGIYNITEITENNLVKLDTELSEVSSVTLSQKAFVGSYNLNEDELLSESLTVGELANIAVGDTLKILTGLGDGYYRITAKSAAGFTVSPGISGTVFGGIDAYEVIRDNYQPFFFIADETRFNAEVTSSFEVWSPMQPVRRMAEGLQATVNGTILTDNRTNFNLQFFDIPVTGSSVTFVSGTNAGSITQAVMFNDSNPHLMTISDSMLAGGCVYEINQMVQNLYQQEYSIVDNHDYYKDKLFTIPVLYLKQITEIDPVSGEVLGDPLTPNSDYFLYTKNSDYKAYRYSVNEKNVIKFSDQWKYKGMRVTYLADPNISIVDQFVSSKVMRTANNDMLVKRMESTIVDVSCQVSGVTEVDAIDIIENYITTKSSVDPVQASDIISLLYEAGATYINTETFLFKSYYLPPTADGNMWEYNPGSRTEVITPAHSAYIPGIVNVEVIDG